MATTTTRLNDHSKKIDRITEQQVEQGRLLSSIDKKLSDEFFDKVNSMYEYVITGNGVASLKAWRGDVVKQLAEIQDGKKDARTERRKWIMNIVIFSLGVLVNAVFRLLGNP